MSLKRNCQYYITIGSLVIGFLFLLLLKANGLAGAQTIQPEAALSNLVQAEQENQQLANDNNRLSQEIEKYKGQQNTSALTAKQLQTAKMNAGLIPVSGPGIRITLDDSKRPATGDNAQNYLIHEQYILQLINILWNGGAEAISVNGQRVTGNTEVFCSGAYIQINGTRQMPPYIIDAIGDVHNLQGALKFYFWDRLGDLQQQYGITRKSEVMDNIVIPAAKQRTYNYAVPVKE